MPPKQVSTRLDASEYEAFQEYCDQQGYTDAEGVRELVSSGVKTGTDPMAAEDRRVTEELAAVRRDQTRHRRRDLAWMGLIVVSIVYLAVAELDILGTQVLTDVGIVIGVAVVATVMLSLAGQL